MLDAWRRSRSVGLFAARASGAIAAAAGTLILARLAPLETVGAVSAWIALVNLVSVAVTLNVESGAVRFLAAGRTPEGAAFARFALRLMAYLSVGAVAGLWMLRGADSVAVSAVAVACLALLRLRAKIGVALGTVAAAVPRMLLVPVCYAGALGAAAAAGVPLEPTVIMALFAMSCGLALATQALVFRPDLPVPGPAAPRAWIGAAACLAPTLLVMEYLRDLVLLAAALVLPGDALGRLAIAVTLSMVPGFAMLAIETSQQAPLARLLRAGDRQGYAGLARTVARWRLASVTGLAAGVVLSAPLLLALAGVPWREVLPLVLPLVLVPLSRAVFGTTQLPLTVLTPQRGLMALTAANAALIVGLVLAGGAMFGALGAAIGAALAVVAGQVGQYALCRASTGCDPSIFSVWPARRTGVRRAAAWIARSGASNTSIRSR